MDGELWRPVVETEEPRSQRIRRRQLARLPDKVLRTAVQAVHESIIITDPGRDGFGPRILYVNPAFTRMTGMTPGDALGRTLHLLDGPKTDSTVLDRMIVKLREGEAYEIEIVNYRKNGQEFINRWLMVPLLDRQGAVTHLLSVQRDITEEKKALLSAKRLESVVESTQAAVLIVGANATVRYVNPAMAALVGKPRHELMGRFLSCLSFLQPSTHGDKLEQVLSRLDRHDTWRGHIDMTGKSGQTVTLQSSISSVCLDNASDLCYALVGRDVTQQRRLDAIASALNMTDNTGYIFAGIRHELGNPVNSLKAALTVVRNNVHNYPREKIADYCDRMIEEIGRMEYLLGSLKSVSPSKSVSIEHVALSPFIERLLSLVRRDLSRRSIELQVQIQQGLCVRANAYALNQVLLNLINNATDALLDCDEPRIELSIEARGDVVEITIADNGCGMTDEQQARLFQPFQTSKTNGTGLGLVITRRLVAQMNGTLLISSEAGDGTFVVISFERS